MARIVIIQRIFAKYRQDILDELHKNIEFTFLHSKNKSGIKQVTTPYSRQIRSFQYASKESNRFLNVFSYLIKNRPDIIIHEFALGIASVYPTYILAKLMGIKFIFWGHGYDRTKGFSPEKNLMDKIRLILLKRSDALILYGQEAKMILSEYIPANKLFVAYNCLNTTVLSEIRDSLEREGRENIKQRIGFNKGYNLVFIGRLLKSKRPDLLIDIYESLRAKYNDLVSIHFVGDGEFLSELEKIVDEKNIRSNVKFHGAIHDDIKNGEILFCSDLMIMPGYVGLSVNHAFNFDCPVVTFKQKKNGPFHSPEIEYLIHEKTGFIVDYHTSEALSKTISNYLDNIDTQILMRQNTRRMVEDTCSLNRFIAGFKDAVEYVTSKQEQLSCPLTLK